MSATVLLCDATMWYIIYCFYNSIRLMNKLREIATVAIPCPAPGTVRIHINKHHMTNTKDRYNFIVLCFIHESFRKCIYINTSKMYFFRT